MKSLALILVLALFVGCTAESKPLPVFEYHGVRLGEPIPAELLSKCKKSQTYLSTPVYTETVTGESKYQSMQIEYWEINGNIEKVAFRTDNPFFQNALDELMKPYCVKLERYSKNWKISNGIIRRNGALNDNWDVESLAYDEYVTKDLQNSKDKAKSLIQ